MKKIFSHKIFSFWNSKMPPLLAIIYYLLSLSAVQTSDYYKDIALFLLSSLGFGITGYLLNDWSDIEENRRQQRLNLVSSLPGSVRWVGVLGAVALALIPWFFLFVNAVILILLCLQLFCYIVYSFKPFRIKERGVAGLILDAAYAHVLPASIAIYAFSKLCRVDIGIGFWGWAEVLAYYTTVGVRNIIVHQAGDYQADKQAGAKTFVVNHGVAYADFLKNRLLVPVEIVLMLGLYFFLPGLRLFCAIFIVYGVYVFCREKSHRNRSLLSGEAVDEKNKDFLSGVMLSEFYEKWQPVLFLAFYMFSVPLFRTLLPVHLLVFLPQTLSFFTDIWFIFFVLVLPFKLTVKFLYHHGLLKALTLVYYHSKHMLYWYFYMPLKRILNR